MAVTIAATDLEVAIRYSDTQVQIDQPGEVLVDAARLRDQAAVSAVGWWVGRGNGDPCGHLLRITPDFSRYVGQVYSPRDLTELMPVRAVLFR